MEKGFVFKLQLFMFLISASNACFGPFLPVYYSDRHLTYSQIGTAFAVSALIGVVFQPLWGYISDKFLNKKKTLILILAVNMLIIIMFIKAGSFGMIISLIILNGIFMCGLGPITDAYTFDVIEEQEGLSYSNFRFMSSAAWAVTNLGLGYVIKIFGINSSFLIYELFAILGLFILLGMKFEGKKSSKKIEYKDINKIFKNIKLILLFVTVFFINAAFIGGVNYMNELVKYNNGDVTNLGMVWFVTCFFEVITFFVTSRLIKKLGIEKVYLIAIIVYFVKFVLDYLVRNAGIIIAIQVFEGIAFTLFIASSLQYLSEKTDVSVRATSMSVYAASGGLGAFCSSLFGGFLLNHISPSELYGIFGILCLVSFFCALGLLERSNKKVYQ